MEGFRKSNLLSPKDDAREVFWTSGHWLYNGFMNAIPETARLFFQEYAFERLDPQRDGDLVIERLLAYGNREKVRWLLEHYGHWRVRSWLSESGARRLPRRRYRLWCVLLDVTENLHEPTPIWPY